MSLVGYARSSGASMGGGGHADHRHARDRRGRAASWLTRFLFAGMVAAASQIATADERHVGFNDDIRPIFTEHCVACHGGVKQAGGLSFAYRDNVFAGGDSGQPAVVPGDLAGSYLVERVTDRDPETRMPPAEHGPALSAAEIARLKQWIAAGAEWEQPWAFTPPRATPLPDVQNSNWSRAPLDRYVLARLESAGRQPSPPAERVEWLRRVSFDLVGLPPSVAEVEAFAADDRPDAYERVVDRLLASPHFGERWASLWLDLARYADTTGYERDPNRDIWPYRDWVIRAFNADMPYDEFTIKQLAGDLVDSPTVDDRLATAFHRNSQTNTEGGTDDEEFRIAAVIDRVNTTWQVWQATTFGCVQCHSHPYDPIRHDEYYQFMALFDDSQDNDVDEDFPLLKVPLKQADYDRAGKLDRRRSKLRRKVHDRVQPLADNVEQWRNLAIDAAESTGSTRLRIQEQYDPEGTSATEVLAEGNISTGSKFTLESPLPDDLSQITALRIDALVRDAESARRISEMGFVLSHLKVEVLPAGGGSAVTLEFKHAFSDEAEPLLDPADSLRDEPWGWGSYTRQWRSHYAVFLLDKAVAIPPGSRMRITLVHDRATVGDAALVIGRGRYAVSSSDTWLQLQKSKEFVAAQQELAELKQRTEKIPSISIPVMEDLPADEDRATFVFTRGLWLDKGRGGPAGHARSLAAAAGRRGSQSPDAGPLAGFGRESAHGPRDGEPRLGAALRHGHRRDGRRFWHFGHAAFPPRAARLFGPSLSARARLEREEALARVGAFGHLPAERACHAHEPGC